MKNNCSCSSGFDDKTIIDELQTIMNEKGYISKQDAENLSEKINKPLSEIYGVISFYSQFNLTPNAKYNIEVCTGTACYILGAELVIEAFKNKLGIDVFENTGDGLFRLSTVRCLGLCGFAPVVSVNGEIYKKVTPQMANEIIDKLKEGEKNSEL